ncbi:hypothetical protein [Protofrankia symbiont of Coriaria ruscifolia]|uniref:hypothetical protein n=1 Tax=Protofrankia symbiont of Coriaria ruscifolia TaxID=1306542 RepID=UPI00104128CB|nr:hypothetical protein [Protofrankia symbiont of Coriaria ruscifolia]
MPCPRFLLSRLPLIGVTIACLFLGSMGCGGGTSTPGPVASGLPATSVSRASTPSPDPASQIRTQIAAAQEGFYRSYLAAVAAPGDRSRVDDLLARYTPQAPARADVASWMAGLASRRVAGRAGPESYYVIEKFAIENPSPQGRVIATVCGYDDGVLYDAVNRAPDGHEIVISDKPVSERTRVTWVEQDTWKIDSVQTVDTWEGVNRCPPRGSGSS